MVTQKNEVQLQYAMRSDSGKYESHINWGELEDLWDVCQNQAKQGGSENLVLVYARKVQDNTPKPKTLYQKIADLAGPHIRSLIPGLFQEDDASEEEKTEENVPTTTEETKEKLVRVSEMSENGQHGSNIFPPSFGLLPHK